MTGQQYVSARQRVVVLTFLTVDDAERWDTYGQPVSVPILGTRIDVAEVPPTDGSKA